MSKSICVAQSVEELKFILKKVQQKVVCLPLNLETQLYCVKKKLEFYNPINFIDNDFYKIALTESENLINNLNFGELKFDSHRKEYKAFIRFRFYSAIFLIDLIDKINEKEKIEKIFISGWNKYISQYSNKNYFVSYLILNLITDIKVSKLENQDMNQISSAGDRKFLIKNSKLNNKINYILMSNIGYNFFRIVLLLRKKNYHILVPIFEKVSFLKRKIFRIFKIIFVEFNSISTNDKSNFILPKIECVYKKKSLSKILNFRKEQELGNLAKLQNQSIAIDNLFNQVNIKLVFTNVTRGIYGYYIDSSKKKNIPSVCIPHGTLAPHFDKFDKIYKNIIAEPISIKHSKFFAIQSKITRSFIKTNNFTNNAINTGNLIFSESKGNKKNKILFAVTLKDFSNFQYLGVEMYYEFLDNLKLFNRIAKEYNLTFLVKPHPSVNHCFDDLKSTFKNLEFTKKKINKVLKETFVTISFSSTVIEDSLYSKTPVILFDRWNRYKHCDAEEDVKKKNSAVYYVKRESDLINCIDTIKNSHNIIFNDYIFEGSSKKNIAELVDKLL
tara:strand:- start:945 stop:2615 length:1671 start_codon:yes stop_codon:yes gene_type:complete